MGSSGQQFLRPICNHKWKIIIIKKKFRHHFHDLKGKRWHIFDLKEAAVLDSQIIICMDKRLKLREKTIIDTFLIWKTRLHPLDIIKTEELIFNCFASSREPCLNVERYASEAMLVRLGQTTRHMCVPLNRRNTSDVFLLGVNFVACSDSWSWEILCLTFPLKL